MYKSLEFVLAFCRFQVQISNLLDILFNGVFKILWILLSIKWDLSLLLVVGWNSRGIGEGRWWREIGRWRLVCLISSEA